MKHLEEKNRINSFWTPYPQVDRAGGMATCDAIAALTYPIMKYGAIGGVWWQKGDVVNLSIKGVEAFCDLVKQALERPEEGKKGLWTREETSGAFLLTAGSDIRTESDKPFVSVNADLILCYYAVDGCVNILEKIGNEGNKLKNFKDILEKFKNEALNGIVDWILKQQNAKGLWAENKSVNGANNPSLTATSFAIRALSLDWRLRLKSTSQAEVEKKILKEIEALTENIEARISEDRKEKELEKETSKPSLSELAFSLSSLIEASDYLGLQQYPNIIYNYPNVLLDKVHELLKKPAEKCTDRELICDYHVTYSTLGPALLALVKCHEALNRYVGKEEGVKRMVELATPRLRYYADILARVGCDVLIQKGCMAERRGREGEWRWDPATSATASLIIALVEYDAKMNVGA